MVNNLFGLILGAEEFGKPISLEVNVLGLGNFYEPALKAIEIVNDNLKKHNWYTFQTTYSAIYETNTKKKHYTKKDQGTIAHEKFHEEMDELGVYNPELYKKISYTYYEILNESLARAKEYQTLFKKNKNKKNLEKTIEKFGNWGHTIYNAAREVLDSKSSEKEIKDLMRNSFCKHKDYNWLTLLFETKYFSFFDSCFEIMQQKNSQEIIKNLYIKLQKDFTGKEFIKDLNRFAKHKKEALTKPFFLNKVSKSILKYQNKNEQFKLMFFTPLEYDIMGDFAYLRDIQSNILNEIGPNLEKNGNLALNIWTNYLKIV